MFNIGVAFLTLSLSSQLVSAKQKCKKAETANEQLEAKVETLEQLVLSLGGSLPDPEAAAAAAARAEEEELAAIQRQRDQEAKALTSSDDKKSTKAKLI